MSFKTKYNCEVCGKERSMNTKHYNRGKHHFCNVKCSGEWKSIHLRGDKNHSFKHGIDSKGYRIIKFKGKSMKYHRFLMEKHLGRKLYPWEVIHHIDHNRINNNLENLHLFNTQDEHNSYHGYLKHLVYNMVRGGFYK